MDKETKHVWMQFRTDPETKQKLSELAGKKGLTMSEQVRRMINKSHSHTFGAELPQ